MTRFEDVEEELSRKRTPSAKAPRQGSMERVSRIEGSVGSRVSKGKTG